MAGVSVLRRLLSERAALRLPRGFHDPIRELALDPALPMEPVLVAERMNALGFRTPVYHATREPNLREFRLTAGRDPKDIPAVHVGTSDAASDRAHQIMNYKEKPGGGVVNIPPAQAPSMNILPLVMRSEKQFMYKGRRPYNEEELRQLVANMPENAAIREHMDLGGLSPIEARQSAFVDNLLRKGYDTVPYINDLEDPGSKSYMVLRPENLRSIHAQFDPAKSKLADLMSSRWLATAGAGGAATAAAAYGKAPDVQDKYD